MGPAPDGEDWVAVHPSDRPLRRSRPLRARPERVARTSGEGEFAVVLPAAKAGGEWALATLYQRHAPAIGRYLRAKVGQDADDLASQTWLDVARNLSSFEGDEDAFRGWVFTIARRRLIDHGRRRARGREEPSDDLGQLAPGAADADAAEVAIETMAGEAAVRRIVELLPADQAEIVILRVVGGLDVAAVAEITGKRPGAIRVAQHRALKRLAAALGEDPDAL